MKANHKYKNTRRKGRRTPVARRYRVRAAKRLIDRGFHVLPVYPVDKTGTCMCGKGSTCPSPGKHPIPQRGVYDATNDLDSIRGYLEKWPTANLAIATGAKFNLLALDFDPHNGSEKSFNAAKEKLGPLPKTVRAISGGGGEHRLFQYPSDFSIKRDTAGKLIGRGVDVLSDNSFLVVSPSRHKSGNRYRWVFERSPWARRPAKLPERWLRHLKNAAGITKPSSAPKTVVLEGDRNSHLTSMVGGWHRKGVSTLKILDQAIAENSANCKPPLGDDEVRRIVDSITQYPGGDALGMADQAEHVMKMMLDRCFAGGDHLIYSGGGFWAYDGKKWVEQNNAWIQGRILESVRLLPTTRNSSALIGQVLQLLKAQQAVNDDRLGFCSEPPSVINCQNGEIWLGTDGAVDFRSHDPKSYLRHCLDVEYDPDAECPLYDDAVTTIFRASDDPDEMVRHWNELFGYIIQPTRTIPIIPILYGSGENGKTILMETVVKLLGQDLVMASRVEDLDKNRFTAGAMVNKLLFLDDDVKNGVRLPDGELKKLSEAKTMTGERKYGDPFTFTCRCVPVLLCNNVMSVSDVSHGLTRRLMVVPFDFTFSKETVEPDRGLFPRIWNSEMSGILNRAIDGFRRVVARKSRFNEPNAVREATQKWLCEANPLPAFIDDRCEVGLKHSVLMRDFYSAYGSWADEMGFTMKQQQARLKSNLEHLGHTTKKGNRGIKVVGLKLRGQ